jgi:MFS transporter, PPP family, 3-phenylpropionic acid transporter
MAPLEARLNNTRYLAAYYFWYFVSVGIFEPYLAPLWREFGLSPAEMGLLNAIMPGVAAVAPFLWTAYADATRRGEGIFRWVTWLTAATALLLPNAERFPLAAAAVSCLAVFRAPLIPFANSMTFRALKGRPQGYAAVRLWGTIGYIVAAVAAGAAMDRLGLRAGMYGAALAMAVCGAVAWAGKSRERVRLAPVGVREILESLRNRRFLILLTATAMAWMSYGPYATFYTIHLQRLGFSRAFAGAAWALAAASELLIMFVWPRLCTLAPPRTWLIVALAAHPIRWLLSSVAHGPVILLATQLTHAFSFGVLYLAAVQGVEALAPDGLRTTAQGVYSSVTFGLGGLIGNLLGGLLYEPMGMRALYLVAALLSAAGTIIYVLGSRGEPYDDRRPARAAAQGRGR